MRSIDSKWQRRAENGDLFQERSSCEHIIHIYEDDYTLLETLERFVVNGLRRGENVVAVATTDHLADLSERINAYGVDGAQLRKRLFCFDAQKSLEQFLINGWPDERLFREFVDDLLASAEGDGRRLRVFGEMVSILWEQGSDAATIRLEQLWNRFVHNGAFPLLCAYPKNGFQRRSESAEQILAAHSKRWLSGNGFMS